MPEEHLHKSVNYLVNSGQTHLEADITAYARRPTPNIAVQV